MARNKTLEGMEKLIEISSVLSAGRDSAKLLEKILLGAKEITNADGGTLYRVNEERSAVTIDIIHTDSLDYAMGGTTGKAIPFPPIPLYNKEGKPNNHMVVTYSALNRKTINIKDAYDTQGFDFTGTRKFDQKTDYRSTSFLTVPMLDHEGDTIGVLQLLNAIDEENGEVIPFSEEAQQLTESLASMAAIALTNQCLIDELKTLLESLLQLIATAIDEKSPYTGGHCRRVQVLTMMLAEAAHQQVDGPFKDFQLDDNIRYELTIAAWLHDCGKLTTPEYVIDKSTKLETIHDRIHLVNNRFEVLKRDARIKRLEAEVAALKKGEKPDIEQLDTKYRAMMEALEDEQNFIQSCNTGSEFMTGRDMERINQVARRIWLDKDGKKQPLLSENEVYNLNVPKGTLTPEERKMIDHHIVATINMLETLPFPKNLQRVPEIAGGHHERMDGKGYPNRLKGTDMPIEARMIAIADIFEALTSKDRPYKKAKMLSESMKILAFMKQDGHIDPDLFNLFVREQLFERYAVEYLKEEQMDRVDISRLSGFVHSGQL